MTEHIADTGKMVTEQQLREIEARMSEGRPVPRITVRKLLAEVRRLQRERDAAVEILGGIESCLICMPGGAGCSAYGSDACYRVKRGQSGNEGV